MQLPDGYTAAKFIKWLRKRARILLRNSSFPSGRFGASYLDDLADEIASEAILRTQSKTEKVRFPFTYYSGFLALIIKERTRAAFKDLSRLPSAIDHRYPDLQETTESVLERLKDPRKTAEELLIERDEIRYQCLLIGQELPALLTELLDRGVNEQQVVGFQIFVNEAVQSVKRGTLILRDVYRRVEPLAEALPPLSTFLRWWTKDLGTRVYRAKLREDIKRLHRNLDGGGANV
jgi:hypothetical protein